MDVLLARYLEMGMGQQLLFYIMIIHRSYLHCFTTSVRHVYEDISGHDQSIPAARGQGETRKLPSLPGGGFHSDGDLSNSKGLGIDSDGVTSTEKVV